MSMLNERKLLLLGLLRHTDMHGYMLNAHLDSTIPITLKKPTAYNLLEIMEKAGWITHREELTGKRAKKIYTIAKVGEEAFFKLLRQQLSTFTPGEHPGMVSISFLDAIPVLDAIKLLKNRKSQIEEYVTGFHKTSEGTSGPDHHHQGSINLVIKYSHRAFTLELEFLNEVIKILEDK